MEVVKGNNSKKAEKPVENQKLSYEQLNDACNQLWQQNQRLTKRNAELEQFSMFKRLDYLFKVLEYKNMFSAEFIGDCVDEIQEAMTIPQKEDEISKK